MINEASRIQKANFIWAYLCVSQFPHFPKDKNNQKDKNPIVSKETHGPKDDISNLGTRGPCLDGERFVRERFQRLDF